MQAHGFLDTPSLIRDRISRRIFDLSSRAYGRFEYNRRMRETNRYDVVIVGAGLTGCILASILARHGIKTLLLETGVHPRFAIGESTVPETTFLFGLLSERYDVPELGHLATFNRARRHVGSTNGVKRNFSFVFHRENRSHVATECCQMPTLSPPLGPDLHLFRQDVDGYLLGVAGSYGARILQQTTLLDVTVDDHVVVNTSRGTFEAEFIVDAGGLRAPVAQGLGLRDPEPHVTTHSRGMFTHMLGVKPFDTCTAPPEVHGLPSPFAQGTLHHLFRGGWLWVIPFNNHPASTNRLCSVGLNLDPRLYPPSKQSPREEFWGLIKRFPSIASQFDGANEVRNWTAASRLQFTSRACAGERFCLMPHAYAFIDPLFSTGLSVSLAALNMLAARLILAQQDRDYSAARFLPIDEKVRGDFEYVDRLVSRSYVAFQDFGLWNAWYRLWAIGTVFGSVGTSEILGRYHRTGRKEAFEDLEHAPYGGVQARELPEFKALFDNAVAVVDLVDAGQLSPQGASSKLFELIRESGLWPAPWGPLDGSTRHPGIFTIPRMIPLVRWVKTKAPAALRDNYYREMGAQHLVAALHGEWKSEVSRSRRSVSLLLRDLLRGYNTDWSARESSGGRSAE